jgi:hypothetical protein
MKRSLKMNTIDLEEQQTGTEHAEYMIYEAIALSGVIALLDEWLNEIWR